MEKRGEKRVSVPGKKPDNNVPVPVPVAQKTERAQPKPAAPAEKSEVSLAVAATEAEEKLKSKRARIERQRARAKSLNDSADWFGVPRVAQEEEMKFESTMSLVGKPVRPSTLTGFRELHVKDMMVILGLWAIRYLIPWVEAWHEFNLHLLFDPSHWASRKSYFAQHELYQFVGQCVISLCLAVVVDFINFKYPIYLIFLTLYLFAPFLGVIIIAVIMARGFDRTYYHEWWHITVVLMGWAMSVPFITFPIQFSSIFIQEDNMSRQAHYNWTAIFVFLEALSASTSYRLIPPNCPTPYFKLVAVWCAIGAVILLMMIQVLSWIRWAKPEIKRLNLCKRKKLPEPTDAADPKKELKQPAADAKPNTALNSAGAPPESYKALRPMKSLWFFLTLIPVLFTSVVIEILKRIRPDEDWDKHDYITATGMLVYGQFIGVLFCVVALFVLRKWLKKLHRIAVFKPDVLALGLPYLINCLALTILMVRFLNLSALKEGDTILGPIPSPDSTYIEFYNVEYRNRTVCIISEHFGPLKVPPRLRRTSLLLDPGAGNNITFNVSLDPRTTPPVTTDVEFEYKKGVWITYVLTLPVQDMSDSDIKAFYSHLEASPVNGTDYVRPKKEPQIVIINTYVGVPMGWYYNITTPSGLTILNQTTKEMAIHREFSPGKVEVTYWTEFHSLVLTGAHNPVTIDFTIEDFHVYTLLLCLYNTMANRWNLSEVVPRMIQYHTTMGIVGPGIERLPSKEELDHDLIIMLGMTMVGMAWMGVFIGFIYLFWLDFPFNGFLTTSLALFWICMALPSELAKNMVGEVGLKLIVTLFALQILFTCLHFGAAIFLYNSKYNFRKRPD